MAGGFDRIESIVRTMDELREQMTEAKVSLAVITRDMFEAKENRQKIYEKQCEIEDKLNMLESKAEKIERDVDDMKPAIAKGKKIFLMFSAMMLAAGFSVAEIKTAILKMFAIVP